MVLSQVLGPIGLLLEAYCDVLKRWNSPNKQQYFWAMFLLFALANCNFLLNREFQHSVDGI
jgi:hypothetical protein